MPPNPYSKAAADQFHGDLSQLIAQTGAQNAPRKLQRLAQQAMGAYFATRDDRFRDLADYAVDYAARLADGRLAPPRRRSA